MRGCSQRGETSGTMIREEFVSRKLVPRSEKFCWDLTGESMIGFVRLYGRLNFKGFLS